MKKRLAVVLSAIMALTMFGGQFAFAASGDQFTDVPSDAWYKPDVDYVAENDYMIGTSDTTFEPQSNLTRAMFATILARYDGAEVDDSVPTIFTDVEVNQWFTGSIGWANEKKIVEGRGDNIFDPTSFITRQELAVMVERYITYVESTTDKVHVTPGVAIPFTDADQISDYAKDAMDKAVIHGLIIGYPDKSVKPLQNITRAETAAVIHRIKWKTRDGRENYTLTYKDKDGNVLATVDAPVGQLVVVGKDLPNPEAPEGMTFVGWQYTAPDGTVITYHPGDKIQLSDDMVLIPIFSDGKEAHDITLIDAVDDSEISKTTVPSGETFKIPEGQEKSGYTFKEWNTQKDGKGTTYKPESTIELASDMTLYAIYTKKSSGGGGGPSVTTEKYVVTAALTGPDTLNAEWPIELSKEYTVSSNGTGDQTIDVVMKDLVTGDNATLLGNGIASLLDDLESAHTKTVDVDGVTYVVNVDPETKQVTATKNGVSVTDWDKQLQVEQDLYEKRMGEFATEAKIAEAEATAEWDAFVNALSPENLINAAPEYLQFKEQTDYVKAVQDAATNAGVVLKKLGDKGFKESYDALVAYMAAAPLGVDLSGYTVDNTVLKTTTDETSGKFDEALKNSNGILRALTDNGKEEYTALFAQEELTQEGLLDTINQRISRAWADQPDDSAAIVAFLKANMVDVDSKFFGNYELKVTVKKA